MSADYKNGQESQDERAHPRHLVHEKASVLLLGRGQKVECQVLDLSLGGCRLKLLERVNLAAGMQVEATFRIRGAPIRLTGTVRWTDHRSTLGIRFAAMSERCQQILQEVVDEIASRRTVLRAVVREEAARDKS